MFLAGSAHYYIFARGRSWHGACVLRALGRASAWKLWLERRISAYAAFLKHPDLWSVPRRRALVTTAATPAPRPAASHARSAEPVLVAPARPSAAEPRRWEASALARSAPITQSTGAASGADALDTLEAHLDSLQQALSQLQLIGGASGAAGAAQTQSSSTLPLARPQRIT